MTRLFDIKVVKWLLVGLAMLPAILYAYLGHFSRMIGDDFSFLTLGKELGPWQSMLYWREKWMSSYSNAFLHGLLGPLDTAIPSIFPTIVIAVWVIGLTGLFRQLLLLMQVSSHRSALAVSLAGLTVAASLSALYTPQSFYFYTGSLAYTLPLALFNCNLALMFALARRVRSGAGLAAASLASAVICFASAGFSEMYLVFQLAFVSLLFLMLLVALPRPQRSRVFALVGGGCLGTLASLMAQWTSPGRIIRSEVIWQYPQFQPIRDLSFLTSQGLRDVHNMALQPDTVTGFLLLLSLGLLASLCAKPNLALVGYSGSPKLGNARLPYVAGLMLQLLFVPAIWAHSSDSAQFLGRFSPPFMLVVLLNVALTVGFLLLLLRFRQLRSFLQSDSKRLPMVVLVYVLAGLLLLFLPQLRDMYITAQNFLFVSALSLLVIAWWERASDKLYPQEQWIALFALAGTAIALLSVAALVIVPRYFVGIGAPRHWSSAAFVLVSLGLVWGFAIGQSFRRQGESMRAGLGKACGGILIIAYASIVVGQIRLAPSFMTFAREWDDRHVLLLELKNSEETRVEIPPRAFDLSVFISNGEIVAETGPVSDKALLAYYGFESITLTDDN